MVFFLENTTLVTVNNSSLYIEEYFILFNLDEDFSYHNFMFEEQLNSINSWIVSVDPGTSHLGCAVAAVFLPWNKFLELKNPPELKDIFCNDYVLQMNVLDLRGIEHRHTQVKFENCRWNHTSELVDRIRHAIQEFPHLFLPDLALKRYKETISKYFHQWCDDITTPMTIRYIAERQPIYSCHVAITNLLQTELVEKENNIPSIRLIAPQSIQTWMWIKGDEYEERKTKTVQLAKTIVDRIRFPRLFSENERVHDMADALVMIQYFAQIILLPQYIELWRQYHSSSLPSNIHIDFFQSAALVFPEHRRRVFQASRKSKSSIFPPGPIGFFGNFQHSPKDSLVTKRSRRV